MSTVRLNYDGWLALPATVRQRLGLITGDRLDLELVDGVITLRPRRARSHLGSPTVTTATRTRGSVVPVPSPHPRPRSSSGSSMNGPSSSASAVAAPPSRGRR